MVTGQKRIGVEAPVPGIAPGIEGGIAGAPAGVAGSGDGRDKTGMTGTPAAVAAVPAPVSSDLKGAPGYVEVDPGKVAVTSAPDNKQDGPSGSQPQSEQPAVSTDTEHETPAVSPEQQQRVDATAGIDRKIAAFREYIDRLPELETPEKRAKREKQEKSKRIIGAVSDGLRAMSNLWFTSQYAPNMYNHEKDSQLNETNRWIDKAKAEREKLREEHLRYAIGLGDAENERAKTLRELEAQLERQKLAREKAQREAEQHGWLAALQPDKQREQKEKADLAGHKAATAKAEAENAPDYYKKRATLEGERINTEKSKQNNYNRPRGGRSGGGSGGSGQTWLAVDDDGNRHTITARSKGHAQNLADGNGWTLAGFVGTSESTNRYGEKTTRVQSHVGITQGGKAAKSNGKKKNRLGL